MEKIVKVYTPESIARILLEPEVLPSERPSAINLSAVYAKTDDLNKIDWGDVTANRKRSIVYLKQMKLVQLGLSQGMAVLAGGIYRNALAQANPADNTGFNQILVKGLREIQKIDPALFNAENKAISIPVADPKTAPG